MSCLVGVAIENNPVGFLAFSQKRRKMQKKEFFIHLMFLTTLTNQVELHCLHQQRRSQTLVIISDFRELKRVY